MTNKEKWANELVDILTEDNSEGFSINKCGIPDKCVKTHCHNCVFSNSIKSCNILRRRWLREEYKEQIYLTKVEESILKALDPKWKYIARDESSHLSLFIYDPMKSSSSGIWEGKYTQPLYDVFKLNIFKMVKWTDSIAWSIEELKKLPVID